MVLGNIVQALGSQATASRAVELGKEAADVAQAEDRAKRAPKGRRREARAQEAIGLASRKAAGALGALGGPLASGAARQAGRAAQSALSEEPSTVPAQGTGESPVPAGRERRPAPPPSPQQLQAGISPVVRRGILEMQQSVAMEALADEEIRRFGRPGQYNAMVEYSRRLLNPEGRRG